MRVGISLKSYRQDLGGPGTYTEQIVRHLVGADDTNEYVLFVPKGCCTDGPLFPGRGNVRQIDTGVRSGLLWDQVVLPALARHTAIDVLFSPFQTIPAWGAFRRAMTVHGAERYMVPDLLPRVNLLRWRFMEAVLLPRVDAVFAVSNTMKRDFCAATGLAPDRVFTTYLGVSEEFAPVTDVTVIDEVRARYDLNDPFILFVGHLFPNKNFGNLLRALGQAAHRIEHRLAVVGGRRWKYEQDLALIDRLGLGDRVRMLGFVPREDLVPLYNAADCFVCPSLYESFGLATLEAMACGCPVVASCTGALPEICADAALLCDPHDPSSIEDAMVRMVSDRTLRAAHIDRGRARASVFTWDRCAAETLRVLQALGHERAGHADPADGAAGPSSPVPHDHLPAPGAGA